MSTAEHAAPALPLSRAVVEAVQSAAARHAGISLQDEAAEAVARAVTDQADDVYCVRQVLEGKAWERQDVRDSLRQHQRRLIFAEMADKGWLPVAWPQEHVTHLRLPPGSPAMVIVELSVPVRRAVP